MVFVTNKTRIKLLYSFVTRYNYLDFLLLPNIEYQQTIFLKTRRTLIYKVLTYLVNSERYMKHIYNHSLIEIATDHLLRLHGVIRGQQLVDLNYDKNKRLLYSIKSQIINSLSLFMNEEEYKYENQNTRIDLKYIEDCFLDEKLKNPIKKIFLQLNNLFRFISVSQYYFDDIIVSTVFEIPCMNLLSKLRYTSMYGCFDMLKKIIYVMDKETNTKVMPWSAIGMEETLDEDHNQIKNEIRRKYKNNKRLNIAHLEKTMNSIFLKEDTINLAMIPNEWYTNHKHNINDLLDEAKLSMENCFIMGIVSSKMFCMILSNIMTKHETIQKYNNYRECYRFCYIKNNRFRSITVV